MTGPITIERNVLTSTIKAGSFSQPIVVGEEFKGQIIATDGPIHSVIVGRNPPYFDPPFAGITGSVRRAPWATEECFARDGEPPAVIRSPISIGLIDTPSIDLTNKWSACRIESPVIGELRVDSMVHALVWSGADQVTGPIASEPGAYTDIGDIVVGNMYCGHGFNTDCKDPTAIFVNQFDTCTIGSLMGGAIYTPTLPPDKTIWIGCQLDWGRPGGPGDIGFAEIPPPPSSNSQTCGQIIVHDELGLQGQVIINGLNDYPNCISQVQDPIRAEWTGLVQITQDPDDIRMYPTAFDPDTSPLYHRPSAQLGGYWDPPANDYSRGAVGVAPFALHYASCTPPNDPIDPSANPPQIMQTAFQHTLVDPSLWVDVILDFYGPIVPAWPGAPLVQVFHLVNGAEIDITPYIVAEIVDDQLAPFNRKVRLYGAGNYSFTVGVFRIQPMLIDNNPTLGYTLRSDGVNGLPSVRPFEYYIELLHDCDNDGDEDPLVVDPPFGCLRLGYCSADFNIDGFIDFFDYGDYADCFEGVYCPPWNDADVNGDGFVDYFDYDMFVEVFEAGC